MVLLKTIVNIVIEEKKSSDNYENKTGSYFTFKKNDIYKLMLQNKTCNHKQ